MDDIFEIYDFTCVTDWERFTADVESLLHEMQLINVQPYPFLQKGALSSADWESHKELLRYDTVEYTFTHYKAQITECFAKKDADAKKWHAENEHLTEASIDLMDSDQEFCTLKPSAHVLTKFYGLREFVVVSPVNKNGTVTDESRQNLILSSFYVATCNTDCQIPIFLQIGEKWRDTYVGVCQSTDVRTQFEMVHLKNRPAKSDNLSGLLDLYKEKAASPLSMTPPVKVSVRVTFKLQEAFDQQWSVEPDEFSADSIDKLRQVIQKRNFSHFPFGAIQDPLQDFYVSCSWNGLNEDMLVENEFYSDLDPLSAPHWSVSVNFSPKYQCLLSEILKEYMKLTGCHKTVDHVLGISVGNVSDLSVPLDRLASRLSPDMGQKLRSIGGSGTGSQFSAAQRSFSGTVLETTSRLPLSEDVVNGLLVYLFPDAAASLAGETLSHPTHSGTDAELPQPQLPAASSERPGSASLPGGAVKMTVRRRSEHGCPSSPSKDSLDADLEAALAQSKIAARNGLTTRLSLLLCHLSNSLQSETALCQIWREFLMELRYRFESGIRIPGLENSVPSLNSCLLNQKIQMLNCCIERKLVREQSKSTKQQQQQTFDNSRNSWDSEEFYDCVDDANLLQDAASSSESKPEGRLRPLDNVCRLLNKPNELLYIPVTQDPAPFTEDMLEEHTHSLIELGTSDDAAALRTKIQCPSLVSDIEAFKAANPGCSFEDFLRWYSPKDLIEKRDEEGRVCYELSHRMSMANNVWIETWENARPQPVSRQKRLFDDTKEAEKILHWLESLKVSEIVRLTLAPLFAVALHQIWDESRIVRTIIEKNLREIAEKFPPITKTANYIDYDDARKLMEVVEATVSRYRALRNRLAAAPNGNVEEYLNSALSPISAPPPSPPYKIGDELDLFILALMQGQDVKVLGGSRDYLGQTITKLFNNDVRVRQAISSEMPAKNQRSLYKFPPWHSKEYVFRSTIPRPLSTSRDSVQRLYVSVKDNEFRAAGAFSEDVLIFTP